MKKKLLFLPLLTLMALSACGGNTPSTTSSSEEYSSSETSSEIKFENYTLSALHAAREAKTLANLSKKAVSIKGKVTFKKDDSSGSSTYVTIQNGKDAMLVNTDVTTGYQVGDAVEVKAIFSYDHNIGILSLGAYHTEVAEAGITVINESISVQEVRITNAEDFYLYNHSLINVNFHVVEETTPKSAVTFEGKVASSEDQVLVAYKLGISEKLPKTGFTVGDEVNYKGAFEFTTLSSGEKLFRYYDSSAFKKAN